MLDRVAKERGARSPVIIIVPGAGLVHPGTGARAGKGAGLGYYTRVEFYWVVIKPECVGVVRDAILGKDRETAGFQYILENLEVDADGWLDWNWDGGADSCGKYRKDGELAAWLSRYCEGGFIVSRSLEGDGASWAY